MIKISESDRAIIYQLDNRCHRPNGPAVAGKGEGYDYITCWYLHGNEHRYYGPTSHLKYWVINGQVIK